MHANRRKLLAIATVAVWVIAYVAWTADWMIGPDPHVLERALRRAPVCLFGAITCWLIGQTLDGIAARPMGHRLTAAIGLCAFGALIYSCVNTVVFYVIAPRWGPTSLGMLVQGAMLEFWVYLAWAALYFAIDGFLEAGEARLRLADAETEALRARTLALAQQVSPHFLFNALNAVSGLILEGRPERAERVAMALAGLLRRSFDSDYEEFVPLAEELAAVYRYLQIEATRFEDRLCFADAVPMELLNTAVPPLILQPLVENAVRHGVARTTTPVLLSVEASLEGDWLHIVVSDNADCGEPAVAGTGVGQTNVRQRLDLLYAGHASLECGSLPRGGYQCLIRIPAVPHAGD